MMRWRCRPSTDDDAGVRPGVAGGRLYQTAGRGSTECRPRWLVGHANVSVAPSGSDAARQEVVALPAATVAAGVPLMVGRAIRPVRSTWIVNEASDAVAVPSLTLIGDAGRGACIGSGRRAREAASRGAEACPGSACSESRTAACRHRDRWPWGGNCRKSRPWRKSRVYR